MNRPILTDDGSLGTATSLYGEIDPGERVLLSGDVGGRGFSALVLTDHQADRIAWMDRVGPLIGGLVILGTLAMAGLAAYCGG